jgi:hypothetical protein
MTEATTPLLTDLYQLNMIHANLDHGKTAALRNLGGSKNHIWMMSGDFVTRVVT